MDATEITTIVSTVGFPIAMCIMMMRQNESLRAEMTSLIKNNTEVMTKVAEKLDTLMGKE